MLNTTFVKSRFKVTIPAYEADFFENELLKKGIDFQLEGKIKNRLNKMVYSVDVKDKEKLESYLRNSGMHYGSDVFPIFVNIEERKTLSLYFKFVSVFAVLMLVLKLLKLVM